MDYDSIILQAGGFGRYHLRLYLLLCLSVIFANVNMMAEVFMIGRTDFRCLLPHESKENATYRLAPNLTHLAHPWDNETQRSSQCERYDVDLTDQDYFMDGNLSLTRSTVRCDSFVHDETTGEHTVVAEFNLVCDDAWLAPASDSLLVVGMVLGAITMGHLSDEYGRKRIFCFCVLMSLISGLLVAASPEIISFIIFRICVGISNNGMILTAYLDAIESVSGQRRLLASLGMDLLTSLGFVSTATFAYFITNWRVLQLTIAVPVVTFLAYWWLIPESIRWLLSKGRKEEAKRELQKVCLANGTELSGDMLDGMLSIDHQTKPDHVKSTVFDLLKHPNLRKKTLQLSFIRFVIFITYFGLSWNTSGFGSNKYMNFAISGLIEIPAYITVCFLSNKWERKVLLISSLLLSGTFLTLTSLVPAHMRWMVILLTVAGKFGITGAIGTATIFAAEQFPTPVRSIGVGTTLTFGFIGGSSYPMILQLSTFWTPFPVVICGCSSFLAGLSVLLLPETSNKKLLDSAMQSS